MRHSFILNKFVVLKSQTLLIYELFHIYFSRIFQTTVLRKLMAASAFYYYSGEYKKIK